MGLRVVCIKLDQEDLDALDAVASKMGVSRSALIRMGIDMVLKEAEKRGGGEEIKFKRLKITI